MPIQRSARRVSASQITAIARDLLEASTLCAIATVSPGGRAHVNTAYFAWSRTFELVWLSAPEARHSRNLHANPSAAVAVFASKQSWGGPDRGIQLFGSAREVDGADARKARRLYQQRFAAYQWTDLGAYAFYRFRPRSVKLFDERSLGSGVFVTASVRSGRLLWALTEKYQARSE